MPLIWLLVTPEEVLLSCDGAVRRNVEASLSLSLFLSLSLSFSLSLSVFMGDELVSMWEDTSHKGCVVL